MKPLRAISLWQPWATLLSLSVKKIETRSWPTSYRGLVAIHAAQKWTADLRELIKEEPFSKYLSDDGHTHDPVELPRGGIVAVGNLHKCLAMDEHPGLLPALGSHERAFGNYDAGRFMWVFDHIWKLSSPVYLRGRQGFWTLSEGETDVVEALMPDDWEEDLHGN